MHIDMLHKEGDEMIVDKLYELVGTEIKLKTPVLNGTASMTKTEKYLVLEAFPHHILCERTCPNGAVIRECFDVGTLVMYGIVR